MVPSEPYAAALKAARLSFYLNLLLCAAKLLGGWLGHSFALLADGFNSLSDIGVSLALMVGMHIARRPPDHNHAYGHGKFEQEISRLISIVVLITGGGIIVEGINRLADYHGPPDTYVLIIALGAIAVKVGLYGYQNRVAQELGSSALAADALNHLVDIAATSCVVLGTLAMRWGGTIWAPADDVAAVVVGALMAVAAGRSIHQSSSELLDLMPPAVVLEGIREIALSHSGVVGVERLVGRKTGMHYLIDLHLEVSGRMPVAEAHALGHRVKDQIMAEMGEIKDIIVHLEPGSASASTAVDEP